jgi:hypothetical protein
MRAEATIARNLPASMRVEAGLGRATRRGHLDAEIHRRLTGGGEQSERPAKSLADEKLGLLRRETESDGSFFVGGDVFEEETRTTAGDGGDGVEHRLREFEHGAEAGEDGVDNLGVGGSERGRGTTGANSLTDCSRRIRHGAGDIAGGGKEAADGREARAGENGEHELTLCERGVRLIEVGELLRLAGEHDRVGAG